MSNTVDNAVKQKIIADYLKTPQGRSKLAASMTQPLRLRRDYTSVGRKTFNPRAPLLIHPFILRQCLGAHVAGRSPIRLIGEQAGKALTSRCL